MRGILFTGGECPRFELVRQWLTDGCIIVAADSGYDSVREYGLAPALVVGDMDSIRDRDAVMRLPEEKRRIYPAEKDDTDTELGLAALRDLGADEIVVVGGGGGRLDHLLGIVALFSRPAGPLVWLLPGNEVHRIEGRWALRVDHGETLSFFPASDGPCRMRSTGLKWPLDGLTWRTGSVGISNVATRDEVTVEMLSGRLIMVRSTQE